MGEKLRPRITLARTMIAVAAFGLALALLRAGRRHIETLDSPVDVLGWSEKGLHLVDGRTLPIPGFRRPPIQSTALAEATKRGVEVGKDRRVIALVRVHHWCGNDPIREHIARVDLTQLLVFCQEGEPARPTALPAYVLAEPQRRFSQSGWEYGDYLGFKHWQDLETPAVIPPNGHVAGSP